MRYIFFGTPRFAEIILDALLRADMPPIALVCNPDRPVGRKKIITAPETKKYIEKHGVSGHEKRITIFQPEALDATFEKKLKDLRPDFFVVAAYAKIIPKSVLDIPKLGTLGIHPSLLPKYRGASPIQSSILDGKKETGVTIFQVDEIADHGPLFAHRASRIANGETYLQLEEKLAKLGGDLLVKTVPKFISGEIKSIAQDGGVATFTKKFRDEDGYVAPEDLKDAEAGGSSKAEIIFRKIRALNPEPGVWTMNNRKRLKLLEANIVNGALKLTKIQEEGQKPKMLLSVRSDR